MAMAGRCAGATAPVRAGVPDPVADLSVLAVAERRDVADYLATLTTAEWDQPTLCPGWSVRDVAGNCRPTTS